jgi:outer membrane protein assembly factor BamE (lipoprotein component of BamABCDE complex)
MQYGSTFSTLTRVFLWTTLVLLVLLGILAALLLRSLDTQYAPGYSERAFKSLKIGDSEERVVSLLGPPISAEVTEPYVEWVYSAEEQKDHAKDGSATGTYTTVRFDGEGRVRDFSGQRQISRNSFTFGDGQDYLALSNEQKRRLRGSTQDEIRKHFGPPRSVYESKAARVLRYSRSPSSSNYHLRMVGLDKEKKVVHLWREIYWD